MQNTIDAVFSISFFSIPFLQCLLPSSSPLRVCVGLVLDALKRARKSNGFTLSPNTLTHIAIHSHYFPFSAPERDRRTPSSLLEHSKLQRCGLEFAELIKSSRRRANSSRPHANFASRESQLLLGTAEETRRRGNYSRSFSLVTSLLRIFGPAGSDSTSNFPLEAVTAPVARCRAYV